MNTLLKRVIEIKNDILKSIDIFESKLGRILIFFHILFMSIVLNLKKLLRIWDLNMPFGQHSGVIDETKDLWNYQGFSINEKYGEINRSKTLMKTFPLKYKSITPKDRYLLQSKSTK